MPVPPELKAPASELLVSCGYETNCETEAEKFDEVATPSVPKSYPHAHSGVNVKLELHTADCVQLTEGSWDGDVQEKSP